MSDIEDFIEELDFLDAVLAETEDDWIWRAAEKRYKNNWSIIRGRDPRHPLVIGGEPWLQPGWGPPSKTKPIALPGSGKVGAPLSLDDDDDKTDPGQLQSAVDAWNVDWFGTKSNEESKPAKLDDDPPKDKTEGDKLMDFFFK